MTVSADPLAFIAGGGRAADLIRACDWNAHPLGPPEGWSDAFCTALGLVLNSPESMILCWGPDLHFFFNDTYIPLLGPRVDWAMGARFDRVWADAWEQAQPIIADAYAGRPQRFTDLPWRLGTDRGEAETWFSFSYSRILDRAGAIAGLFILTTETTARVRGEQARREAELRLRRAQQAGGIGLFAVDADGNVDASPEFAALYGLSDDGSIPADRYEALVLPEDRHLTSTVGSRRSGHAPLDVEYRIRRADTGEVRWIARKGEIEHDAAGRFTRFVGIARDITDQVEIRRQLAAEREQLTQMFEQAPTFMAILRGPDHRIERVNPGYVRLVGGRDVVGQTVAQALPDAVDQGFLAILDDVYREGRPFVAAGHQYAAQAGPDAPVDVRYVDFVYQPLRDADGAVTGIFVEGADVTDRTLSAKALADAEDRYETLLASIDIGFCIIAMRYDDDTGRACDYQIVDANAAFQRQTGLGDQVGNWVSQFAPDLERHWFDTYGDVARTRTAIRFENEAAPFGRWYDVTALPVGPPDEFRVAVLFNDITHTKRLERELRDRNQGLAGEVDARTRERDRLWTISRDPFLIADADGVWRAASPAWTDILGWTQEELIGRTSEWMEHPDDRATTRREVEMLAGGGDTRRFENRFIGRDGAYRWFAWNAVQEHGVLFCNARDVSIEKDQAIHLARAEDQLRQAQKVEAVGQLTGGVAHDFNNLLTVIRGSVDLLRRPDLTEDRRRRYTDAIADTADRATRLTSQLLAFARRSALRPEVFDVRDSVQALVDMVGTLIGPRIAIAVDLPATHCFIDADHSQFDTAIVNMAVNARDAMEQVGALSIAVDVADAIPAPGGGPGVPGRYVTVALTDTGAGIPADRIGQIFEPFYSTKGPGHGTGLGLSQVFGFSKQSGGEVLVDSVAGEGATFTLYLPRVAPPAATAPDAAPVDAPLLTVGACVLVVEDNAEVGRFALQALTELGYRTLLAPDGAAALDILAIDADRFDVVFSDVVMPGMSGIELAQAVRARYPWLPVVLTSGYSTVLVEDGGHGFELLQKPYAVAELAAVLGKVVAWRDAGPA